MKEKMYLSLTGHDNDRPTLTKMINEAAGDVEAFTKAYERRFLCAAGLEPEEEAKKHWGENCIPVN